MKRKNCFIRICLCVLCFLLFPISAKAEEEAVYIVKDEQDRDLFTIAVQVQVGDMYIAQDNMQYRLVEVNGFTAKAQALGKVTLPESLPKAQQSLDHSAQHAFAYVSSLSAQRADAEKQRKIGIYCTHSDESYLPEDGTSSKETAGGIYDVAYSFKKALEENGITVTLDETLHHPHDAGAYRRSRRTAMELIRQGQDVMIDIHRDGVEAREYEGEVNGDKTSKVRLLVGRSNPNMDVNKQFALQLKATADAWYPGLIKDIFIGKGNYNQELLPQSILMEFGTHKISKADAILATQYMADVVAASVYGSLQAEPTLPPSSSAPPQSRQNNPLSGKEKRNTGWIFGVLAALGFVALVWFLYQLWTRGGMKGMGKRMQRTTSEVTGGLFGQKHEGSENESSENENMENSGTENESMKNENSGEDHSKAGHSADENSKEPHS